LWFPFASALHVNALSAAQKHLDVNELFGDIELAGERTAVELLQCIELLARPERCTGVLLLAS
jgi:hypothetical protein